MDTTAFKYNTCVCTIVNVQICNVMDPFLLFFPAICPRSLSILYSESLENKFLGAAAPEPNQNSAQFFFRFPRSYEKPEMFKAQKIMIER